MTAKDLLRLAGPELAQAIVEAGGAIPSMRALSCAKAHAAIREAWASGMTIQAIVAAYPQYKERNIRAIIAAGLN